MLHLNFAMFSAQLINVMSQLMILSQRRLYEATMLHAYQSRLASGIVSHIVRTEHDKYICGFRGFAAGSFQSQKTQPIADVWRHIPTRDVTSVYVITLPSPELRPPQARITDFVKSTLQ